MISFETLPFDEAIRSFEDKTVLTPDKYRALVADARAKAFSVSGITRMDVLTDMYSAIDTAISEGTTFGDFRKSLKGIMAKRGWQGMNPYRLDTVYRTNIQSAYQAGHFVRQMEVAESLPYWQYVAVMDGRTRPLHAAMHGTTLRYDDPFWKTSYPPNGFNCRCTVRALSQGQLAEEKSPVSKDPPGIADPGFDHNPGSVAYRDVLAAKNIDQAGRESWTPLLDRGITEARRPVRVPYDPLPARLGPTLKDLGGDKNKLRSLFDQAMGGQSVMVRTPDNDSLQLSGYLFDHLTFDGREAFFPLIRPTAENPFEIWLMPMRGKETGRIVMRKRFIRFFEDEKQRHVMLSAECQQGTFVGYTFFRGDKEGYFMKQRSGWLLYGR